MNLEGNVYGDWKVLKKGKGKLVSNGKNRPKVLKDTWVCKCFCGYCDGTEREVIEANLIKGASNGCGKKHRIQNGKNNKKYNKYDLTGEFGIGYTNCGYKFLFDLEDYEKIKDYCWHKHKDGYLRTRYDVVDGKNKYTLMHNWILGYVDKSGKNNVDHRNNKPYDNQKENLRICTHLENMQNVKKRKNNKSGVTGVYCVENGIKRWKANITVNKQQIHLGSFFTKEEAVNARVVAEIKYFGEYRYTGE